MDSSDDEWEQEFRRPSAPHDGQLDAAMDMQGMVEDAFGEFDEAPPNLPTTKGRLQDIVMDAFAIVDKLANIGDDESDDEMDEEPMGDNECSNPSTENHDDPRALEEAMDEVYHGAKSSVLAATILIMTLCTIHGVSNKFADQFFTLFREHLPPSENQLPKNYYAAKALIWKLGLNYNTIHACQGGCILFRGQYEDATHCPKRMKPRYRDEGKK